MCGRFSLTIEEADIEKRFNARFYSNDLARRYNVAPGQLTAVITNERPEEIQLLKWGLVPSWAKDPKIGNRMINARAETIFEKPSFRNLIMKRRCLVLSDGFFEWQPGTGKMKQPWRILMKNDDLFAYAGLWDSRTDHETGEILSTFTIITTHANEKVASIHDRMPVIMHREDEQEWIGSNLRRETIHSYLRPIEPELIRLYQVSTLVNNPANDTKEVIEPLP